MTGTEWLLLIPPIVYTGLSIPLIVLLVKTHNEVKIRKDEKPKKLKLSQEVTEYRLNDYDLGPDRGDGWDFSEENVKVQARETGKNYSLVWHDPEYYTEVDPIPDATDSTKWKRIHHSMETCDTRGRWYDMATGDYMKNQYCQYLRWLELKAREEEFARLEEEMENGRRKG